ncbi:MAG: hypothetical protein SVZ03_15615 [Spirochaetota bacterium]|nr:hypothetical protein [Spirochaetota bacterium]
MKKIIIFILVLLFTSGSCEQNKERDVLIKKWFKDSNTYIIVCKGYPKSGSSGLARIETAKEAALINAQYLAKGIFKETLDVITNGTIEDYKIYDDYVVINYIITKKGLKKYLRKK